MYETSGLGIYRIVIVDSIFLACVHAVRVSALLNPVERARFMCALSKFLKRPHRENFSWSVRRTLLLSFDRFCLEHLIVLDRNWPSRTPND